MVKTIKIACTGAEFLKYSVLIPFQGILKTLSEENYQKLKKEILDLGFSEPISIWKKDGKFYILNGHQRCLTVKRMVEKEGFTCPPLPINVVEAKTKKEAKKKVLALTSQYGTMTEAGLKGFMSDAGLTFGEVKASFNFPEVNFGKLEKSFGASGAGEDDVPEAPKKPRSRLGDLYVLGRHRLLCGDATVSERVEFLMDGKRADMVLTDPPYGINLDTDYSKLKSDSGHRGKKFPPLLGDDKPFDPGHLFVDFKSAGEVLLFGADYYADKIPSGGSWYVWDKRQSDRLDIPLTLDNVFGSAFELCWSKTKHKREILRVVWTAGLGQGMDEERVGRNNSPRRVHPTQKPLDLIYKIFDRAKGNNVVDPYGGSGSTLIACEKTDRHCFMMELEPLYIDVIVSRWCKFTGQTDIIKNGKKIKWLSD